MAPNHSRANAPPIQMMIIVSMDKLQLTGRNLGRVFNSRRGCVRAMQLRCFETKLPNLLLKTRPKQLLASLPLDIALSVVRSFGASTEICH
jgi:hypothetical protein